MWTHHADLNDCDFLAIWQTHECSWIRDRSLQELWFVVEHQISAVDNANTVMDTCIVHDQVKRGLSFPLLKHCTFFQLCGISHSFLWSKICIRVLTILTVGSWIESCYTCSIARYISTPLIVLLVSGGTWFGESIIKMATFLQWTRSKIFIETFQLVGC